MKTLGILIIALCLSALPAPSTPMSPSEGPHFAVSPTIVCFSHVVLGMERLDSVVVSNHGSSPLNISSTFTDNAAFTIYPAAAAIEPSGSATFYVTFAPTTVGFQSGVAIFAHDGPNTMDAIVLEGGGAICIHPSYREGWNMVSVPVQEINCADHVLYPDAGSCIFDFHASYHQDTTLIQGRGYWVRFDRPTTVHYIGFPVDQETVSVTEKWNIVGSVTSPVAVLNITSVPPGIGTSEFFSYDGVYSKADTLRPGHAYWVKLDQGGKIILNSAPLADKACAIRVTRDGEMPPPRPGERLNTAPDIPLTFGISQNYPNPFNPVTTIGYDLPFDADVNLAVYNVLGERVALLVTGFQPAGHRSVAFLGENLPSGVYTCRLSAGNVSDAIKMVLIR